MKGVEIVQVHRPASMLPSICSPDRWERHQARYRLQSGGAELVIARARRLANRVLPMVASLPCGCHLDDLCPVARVLYEARLGDEFVSHRQALHPGKRLRIRVWR